MSPLSLFDIHISDLTYFLILCRQRCIFGLISQVSKLIGQLVGQTAEVIGVGVRLGDLEGDKEGL